MSLAKTQKRLGREELRRNRWREAPTFFVLSTGRCGTRTLAQVLDLAPDAFVQHEPIPRLNRQCREVYESWDSSPAPYRLLIEACREDFVYRAYEGGQVYGETANRLTYFAPALHEVFSNSRFIHLVRDPRDVVRSGMDRGWYDSNKWDEGRIVPRPGDPFFDRWPALSLFEKCAWFWYETNRYARDFLKGLPPERVLTVKSEGLFLGDPDVLRPIFHFFQIEFPKPKLINKVIGRKENRQRRRTFPDVVKWTDEQTGTLRSIAGPMMDILGY